MCPLVDGVGAVNVLMSSEYMAGICVDDIPILSGFVQCL
jgi:hypothetical protein